ncbi:MAG TPA: NAD(P)H-binding protein [Edaphobacter sp.]|nr:NAD(P)H-binding protein [Edaphobacter sp.]
MKITIFGASGATGNLLTQRCLNAGHSITALLRHPDSFRFRNSVRALRGSVFQPADVVQAISGADAVLSALGARSLHKEDVLERAVPVIVRAMQQENVQRIIVLGSAGAKPDALDKQPVLRWIVENLVYTTVMKWPVASQRSQYETLAASELDWTMVMPPLLTNGHGRGTWRTDAFALPRNAVRISRDDVAAFMMQQLDDPQWVRKAVYIAW